MLGDMGIDFKGLSDMMKMVLLGTMIVTSQKFMTEVIRLECSWRFRGSLLIITLNYTGFNKALLKVA